ncbi:hypothetical protein DFH09DRAFT_1073189 [Mycena vulgaris]|nr:hypothetical protein DFH09DRAFT_1073189 [Mycena vulgaris]
MARNGMKPQNTPASVYSWGQVETGDSADLGYPRRTKTSKYYASSTIKFTWGSPTMPNNVIVELIEAETSIYSGWLVIDLLHMKLFLSTQGAGLPGTQRGTPPSPPLRHECPQQRNYPVQSVPPLVIAPLGGLWYERARPCTLIPGD